MIWNIFSRESSISSEKKDFAPDCYRGGFIAVGWNKVRIVGSIDRNQYMRQFNRCYKGDMRRASSLWSFYHRVSYGDYILCPNKYTDRCYGGMIVGKARYIAKVQDSCPFAHRRNVKWFGSISYATARSKWGNRFSGNQTVSRIDSSSADFESVFKTRHFVRSSKKSVPVMPDQEWGRQAELRAIEWLKSTRSAEPKDVSKENKGWDIECGGEFFEVKGRKSPRTVIRLTQNEWNAAKRLKRQYTLLLFTAPHERALRTQVPEEFPNPVETEQWEMKTRTIREYFLQ